MRYLWLCKNASELTDGQISKIGRKHQRNSVSDKKKKLLEFFNLKPRDPVILALCSQESFQKALDKAKRRVEREKKRLLREEKKLKKRKF